MKSTTSGKRVAFVLLSILTVMLVISMFSFDGGSMRVAGENVHGVSGFSGFVLACGIGMLALFLALSVTGIVLAGVAILLCIVFGVVLGSVVLALLPLLFPVLLVVGLVAIFSKRKSV